MLRTASSSASVLVLLAMWLIAGSNAVAGPILKETFTHGAMGTEFAFTIFTRPGDKDTGEIRKIADEAFAVVDDLDSRISVWRPDSQVTYINDHAATGPVKAAPDVIDLLSYCKQVHAETGGAFDVTVGPLVNLWGFYRSESADRRLPSEQELADARAKVGMDKVEIDRNERTISFSQEGVRLDFGGIGKGLALDRALGVLKRHGVKAAALSAGTSSIVVLGAPPHEGAWKVRIRNPYNDQKSLDEVFLRDQALSTSGSYEKFFELNGKKYCHIFDPHTGRPVEGMLSVTVIGPSGMETDALGTAFFVLGPEKVRRYCEVHPGLQVILLPEAEESALRPLRIGNGREVGGKGP